MIDLEVIHRIQETLESRKGAAPDSSYVSSLYAKGTDAICKKIATQSIGLATDDRNTCSRPVLLARTRSTTSSSGLAKPAA